MIMSAKYNVYSGRLILFFHQGGNNNKKVLVNNITHPKWGVLAINF